MHFDSSLVLRIVFYYLIGANLVGFMIMGWDKFLAKKNRRRISERSLVNFALIFGGIGVLAGMYFFRHKTLKNKFRYGIPCIIGVQLISTILLLEYFEISEFGLF